MLYFSPLIVKLMTSTVNKCLCTIIKNLLKKKKNRSDFLIFIFTYWRFSYIVHFKNHSIKARGGGNALITLTNDGVRRNTK